MTGNGRVTNDAPPRPLLSLVDLGYTCCMIRHALLTTALLPFSVLAQQPDLKTLDAYIADALISFDQPGLAVGAS